MGLAAFLRGMAPVALVAALPVPAMAQDGNAQVAEAVAALRAITALKADFVQSDSNGGSVRGTLYLKRPGKIRFQYQPGYPMTILSDGHALFMIDKEVNQTQRWPINNSPLGALLDPNKDAARFGRLVPVNDPGAVAIEVKDKTHPEYGTMTLVFRRKGGAPGGMELESWITRDAQNRQTRIALSGQQYNVNPSEDLFRFTDTRARPHK
ncbi:LolA family protein [Novosphingobium terrae]|uniref:LolA family protein n=1 Tax=Novosphingobium terrae TaxID=2726189 RepID=UPI001F134891|nr:outer membrane lipoprotein carrier protein LolA [Novosphingobium terrae]